MTPEPISAATAEPRAANPDGTDRGNGRLLIAPIALALARRPDLWVVAAGAGLSLAGRGWWRRPPFLPIPDPDWLRFRLTTAYGGDGTLDDSSAFDVGDLITWLEWRKEWPD